VAILERHLQLRARLEDQGLFQHNHLFFTDEGAPIPDVRYPYGRWERTLRRLGIRYRRPYAARHTSVSWKLMLGRNPLLVAKEHGHRMLTMLTVYAAWTEGAVEADLIALREATGYTRRKSPRHRQSPRLLPADQLRTRSGTTLVCTRRVIQVQAVRNGRKQSWNRAGHLAPNTALRRWRSYSSA